MTQQDFDDTFYLWSLQSQSPLLREFQAHLESKAAPSLTFQRSESGEVCTMTCANKYFESRVRVVAETVPSSVASLPAAFLLFADEMQHWREIESDLRFKSLLAQPDVKVKALIVSGRLCGKIDVSKLYDQWDAYFLVFFLPPDDEGEVVEEVLEIVRNALWTPRAQPAPTSSNNEAVEGELEDDAEAFSTIFSQILRFKEANRAASPHSKREKASALILELASHLGGIDEDST